jgi:Skp family chaperone for outer membrane proteins
MKRSLLFLTLITGLATSLVAQGSPSIAVVNMTDLLGGYYKAQQDLEEFSISVSNANREIEIQRKELEELLSEVPDLRQKVEMAQAIIEGAENTTPRSDEAVISAGEEALAQLNAINQEFEAKRQKLVTFQEDTDEMLNERRNSILTRHLIFIRGVVSDYATEMDYDLVVNTTQGVIYSKESMDITSAVMDILEG